MDLFKYLTTRGVKIPYHKEMTRDLNIVNVKDPKRLYYSMAMHIGKPAKPVVAVGDSVKIGSLLGKSQGGISANIHSSVSGKVISIDEDGGYWGEDQYKRRKRHVSDAPDVSITALSASTDPNKFGL